MVTNCPCPRFCYNQPSARWTTTPIPWPKTVRRAACWTHPLPHGSLFLFIDESTLIRWWMTHIHPLISTAYLADGIRCCMSLDNPVANPVLYRTDQPAGNHEVNRFRAVLLLLFAICSCYANQFEFITWFAIQIYVHVTGCSSRIFNLYMVIPSSSAAAWFRRQMMANRPSFYRLSMNWWLSTVVPNNAQKQLARCNFVGIRFRWSFTSTEVLPLTDALTIGMSFNSFNWAPWLSAGLFK